MKPGKSSIQSASTKKKVDERSETKKFYSKTPKVIPLTEEEELPKNKTYLKDLTLVKIVMGTACISKCLFNI